MAIAGRAHSKLLMSVFEAIAISQSVTVSML
ncbi:hypothetical protein FP2506_17619 [Fulvimarina pelagi HTCC2506]|uniref:Uncharacterized protein n=1 Tax=Fulvimarina pelagi HTCC2506 TaxID=314231 RepID=Q0FY24_9HYPH|nr:hypothetical protein FP2506_17619 [Fulvimarina pelagi HTCC2506]